MHLFKWRYYFEYFCLVEKWDAPYGSAPRSGSLRDREAHFQTYATKNFSKFLLKPTQHFSLISECFIGGNKNFNFINAVYLLRLSFLVNFVEFY